MSRIFITVSIPLLLLIDQIGFAAEADLDACNRLYHDSAYAEAITCYENLGTSPELLFNIGNSYTRLGKTGYGVLYYLRGLCLAPEDPDILSNLSRIRKENSLFPQEPAVTDQIFSLLTINQWSYLCLAALIFYLLFLVFNLRKRKGRGTEVAVTLTCLIVFSLAACGGMYQYRQWHQSVVVEDTRLLVSPFENGESTGLIGQGRLIMPHKTYKDFVYISDEMGRTGWLKIESQVPIIPK